MRDEVSAWIEKVIIPTYGIGEPEKNPIFLQKRVYQGSSGAVYPHPVVEKIVDVKTDKTYTAVFIENEFLKIMVLPELGGRIQRAYDKIRQRDFIYYNQVIKPALVGLTGPWISGGIEFNWPQHHRPSTFDPVDFSIEENADGSKTVWVNEVELMTRTKGMAGFTLFPGKAYLQVKAKLYNRTFFPQTFLWWANPAVKVNDHYQSVFPPDVHAVYDHGKRDVSDFPIATGTYYKVNYAPGTDISRYKNIPVPTSFMAVESKYDFIGCYEHDTQAGMLHVANHHLVPGKKQWTWGKGDFGIAWDKNLTDEDGPYIELMCGAFTDNQPDFSWLQPNEQKTFEQYFMPYAGIGVVKNATIDAAVNLEFRKDKADIRVYVTSVFPSATIRLSSGTDILFETKSDLSPEKFFISEVVLNVSTLPETCELCVLDKDGRTLVRYTPENKVKQVPPPAVAAKHPADIASNELLFLNGLHLEQYRHATFSPVDYYVEALKRDEADVRNNNALGLWLLRRGQFAKAEDFFRRAIRTLTLRNPNPYDGEPYYNLGVCLKMLGRTDEAYEAFYKSVWCDAWQHAAYLQLARIEASKNKFSEALDLVEKSLIKNDHSHTARHLKTILLRKLGRHKDAIQYIGLSLQLDRFNYGCLFEQSLLADINAGGTSDELVQLSRGAFNNYVEYAIDYMHGGFYKEALDLLLLFLNSKRSGKINPLVYYYLAYFERKVDGGDRSDKYLQLALDADPSFCFPSKIEDVLVLQFAVEKNADDYKAFYYLGNFWYAYDQFDDAIKCWEKSAQVNAQFPTVQRNLALAYHNKRKDVQRSLDCMELAFELDKMDARVLMELDQLHKLCNYPAKQRLKLLEQHISLVEQRDDLFLERIALYNQLGEYKTAKELLATRKFHPWEGGEGKTVSQHYMCHLELAKVAITSRKYDTALVFLASASVFPENLGEGKLPGAQENDIYYLEALCYGKLNMKIEATARFRQATIGISEPVQAIFYNDPQPDKIVYQGLAWLKLGDPKKAENIFNRMIEFGNQHMNDDIKIDYFAVSLPDLLVFDQDLNRKNKIHCTYLIALGNLGLMNFEKARELFDKVLGEDVNHQGAIIHRNMIGFLKLELQTI